MIKCVTYDNVRDILNCNVYIYGAGVYAEDIRAWLLRAGIQKATYIVDDEYLSKYTILSENILSLSNYKKIKCNSDVVINGIANVSNFKRVLRSEVFDDFRVLYDPNPMWENEKSYFELHQQEIDLVENLFADEKSGRIMRAFLRAKNGEVEGINEDILLASEEKTYFNGLTKNKADGAFVDCGAFNGDSVYEYLSFNNDENQCEIFAFEPDADTYSSLLKKYSSMNNVHCINKGIWDKQDTLGFVSGKKMGSGLADNCDIGGIKTEVTDIDSVAGETKIGFIKMDIEGCELKGLQGASATIKRDYPVLAISAYHKKEDMIFLPKYIKSLENDEWGYKLYLLHHGVCAYELVLYAIPCRKRRC